VAGKKRSYAKASSKNSSAGQKGSSRALLVILFWLAFAIFILGLFLFNRESIIKSLQTIQSETASGKPPAEEPVRPTEAPDRSISVPPPATQPAVQGTSAEVSSQAVSDSSETQAGGQTEQKPADLRDRVLYFTQVDRSGTILRVKVDRKLPASDTPLTDVLKTLIAGPSEDEKRKGLISLIPPDTKLQTATVRDSTAYISFSEDFQYNTYGVEGYSGQLRQIVFTATEFSNIKDVQILIEGRRIDYLGEGIWIGSPISRDTL